MLRTWSIKHFGTISGGLLSLITLTVLRHVPLVWGVIVLPVEIAGIGTLVRYLHLPHLDEQVIYLWGGYMSVGIVWFAGSWLWMHR